MSVTTGGLKDFTGTNCKIEFPATGTYPNGDLVVFKINLSPDQLAPTGISQTLRYWVVNNYGTNATFSTLDKFIVDNLGSYGSSSNASDYKLYKRQSNDDGTTWALQDNADIQSTTNNNTLTFSTNNNNTSFSQFVLSFEGVPLGVTMLSLSGENQGRENVLKWQNSNELNNKGFFVEKSGDGFSFESIGYVDGHGTTNTLQSYSFIDENPYSLTYYRLNQEDYDGKTTYSNVISIERNTILNESIVYPNPVSDKLNIEFTANNQEAVTFELVNSIGQCVYIYTHVPTKGKNQLYISTSQFATGMYTLKMHSKSSVINHKVVFE